MSTDSNSSPAKSSPAPDVTIPASCSKTPIKSSSSQPAPPSVPTPKHVSQDELFMLQGCLRRWRTEVEVDVRGQCKGHDANYLILMSCRSSNLVYLGI